MAPVNEFPLYLSAFLKANSDLSKQAHVDEEDIRIWALSHNLPPEKYPYPKESYTFFDILLEIKWADEKIRTYLKRIHAVYNEIKPDYLIGSAVLYKIDSPDGLCDKILCHFLRN